MFALARIAVVACVGAVLAAVAWEMDRRLISSPLHLAEVSPWVVILSGSVVFGIVGAWRERVLWVERRNAALNCAVARELALLHPEGETEMSLSLTSIREFRAAVWRYTIATRGCIFSGHIASRRRPTLADVLQELRRGAEGLSMLAGHDRDEFPEESDADSLFDFSAYQFRNPRVRLSMLFSQIYHLIEEAEALIVEDAHSSSSTRAAELLQELRQLIAVQEER